MPRIARRLPASTAPLRAHLSLTGGNGTPVADSPADRLARVESLLEDIQQRLDTQFQRIADLQVQLDRSMAAKAKNDR
jgi:hypothetical protein